MKSFIRLNNELKYFLVITPLVLAVQFLFPKFFPISQLPVYLFLGIGFSYFLSPYLSWGILAPLCWGIYFYTIANISYLIVNYSYIQVIMGLASSVLIVIFAGIIKGWNNLRHHLQAKKYAKELGYLSDNQIFYDTQSIKESQLSEDEIKFFKTDVNKRYQKYLYLRSVSGEMEKLVPNYARSIQLIQGIFRELAETPKLMLELDDFLYKHLDEYTQITRNIINLQENLVKEKEDKQLIENASKKLTAMEADFVKDYKMVTEDERQALRELSH